jgi:hypothetical protein
VQRLPVLHHRTARQAWAKYRACRHPVEKTRWHLVGLLLRTDDLRTPARAAAVVGASVITARAVLERWNADGPGGRTDRRASNRGKPPLTDERRGELFAALEKRPPDGGLWTGPKVSRDVRDRWGVAVRPQAGWRWLWPRSPPAPTPRGTRCWWSSRATPGGTWRGGWWCPRTWCGTSCRRALRNADPPGRSGRPSGRPWRIGRSAGSTDSGRSSGHGWRTGPNTQTPCSRSSGPIGRNASNSNDSV